MPQLDTLRTFAVILVLFEHWLPEGHWFKILPFGTIGVTLFFVLSGFLITEILLRSRNIAEDNEQKKFHQLKQFYARRTLRIFPIYYITLFVSFILNIQNIRDKFLWFLFYASNIYFFKTQSWNGQLSHLWTLAVEEQFYILWPFVILFVPKKYLFKSIIAFTFIGPLFRGIMFFFSDGTETASYFIQILTPACIDCFGLGAILAYYRINAGNDFSLNSRPAFLFLAGNILSMAILLLFEENIISTALFKFNISVIALFIISKTSIGFTGVMKIIFENKILMYLGKISYGLYLFHNFIPMIYLNSGLVYFKNGLLNFIIQFIMLVAIASISWFLIEKPINGLKKYFSYS